MPRSRSDSFVAVIDALDTIATTTTSTLTIDALRDALRAAGCTNFGAQDNYIRRAIREKVLRGEAREIGRCAYRFIGSPASSSAAEPAPSAPVEIAHEADALTTPTLDPTYRMTPPLRAYFERIAASAQSGNIEQLRLVGPAGCGKTEAALQLAAIAGFDAFVIDCSIVREPRDWFGSRTVRGGAIAWQDSQFVRAVTRGRTVIVLDEANRASLTVGNALLPLLDRRRATLVEERGSVVRVAPGTIIVATMNEGAQYTGTGPMDAALRDRFPRVIECRYLSATDEARLLVDRTGIDAANAARLVEIAECTRQTAAGVGTFSTVLSTRQLLAAAADLKMVGPLSLAFTVANLFPSEGGTESERAQIVSLLVGKYGDLSTLTA